MAEPPIDFERRCLEELDKTAGLLQQTANLLQHWINKKTAPDLALLKDYLRAIDQRITAVKSLMFFADYTPLSYPSASSPPDVGAST